MKIVFFFFLFSFSGLRKRGLLYYEYNSKISHSRSSLRSMHMLFLEGEGEIADARSYLPLEKYMHTYEATMTVCACKELLCVNVS